MRLERVGIPLNRFNIFVPVKPRPRFPMSFVMVFIKNTMTNDIGNLGLGFTGTKTSNNLSLPTRWT
jgi:hypothetical protein